MAGVIITNPTAKKKHIKTRFLFFDFIIYTQKCKKKVFESESFFMFLYFCKYDFIKVSI